jgi:putative transposase
MSKNNVIELSGRDTTIDPLTELLRTGAQQLIHQAV